MNSQNLIVSLLNSSKNCKKSLKGLNCPTMSALKKSGPWTKLKPKLLSKRSCTPTRLFICNNWTFHGSLQLIISLHFAQRNLEESVAMLLWEHKVAKKPTQQLKATQWFSKLTQWLTLLTSNSSSKPISLLNKVALKLIPSLRILPMHLKIKHKILIRLKSMLK